MSEEDRYAKGYAQQSDRDWYNAEEGDTVVDPSHSQLLLLVPTEQQEKSLETTKLAALASSDAERRYAKRTRFSQRHSERIKDTDRWESTQLRQGGLEQKSGFDPAEDNDHDTGSVHLIVHDRPPPFLGSDPVDGFGDASAEAKFDPVNPVKDPTSDIATAARTGSSLVKEQREKRERAKQMRELHGGGTTLGTILGRHETVAEADAVADNRRFADLLSGAVVGQSEFSKGKSIREQRHFLPAFAVKEQLLQLVRENRVVVVVGETGSGKTTQIPQYLDEAGYTAGGRMMIGCTQPRRVAAVSVAKRVAEETGSPGIGGSSGTVGYAIRFEDCTGPATRIKFMTDGVLLRETLRDPDLDAYGAIIIDEAHERSLQTDVLLGLLRGVLSRRRDLRVIVTSATMDADRFSRFFGDAPVFKIPGRTFPVDILYSRGPPDDFVDAAVKQVLSIHVGHPPGDILVFMTGQEDIEATCAAIEERIATDLRAEESASGQNPSQVQPLLVLPIYSQLPADLQARIFAPAPSGTRKCIVATNIAETSLTVDGIRYVIDTGLSKVKVYNARIGMDALTIAPVSQAGARQRAGRAGRTGPGVCFRLYTESTYAHDLLVSAVPEIQRTNLSNVILLLKSLGIGDVARFPLLDAPPAASLQSALAGLWALGALGDDGQLTGLGRRMVEFPLDPTLSKMLLVAEQLSCVADVLTIVSMLSVPSVFFRPRERAEEADALREKFAVPESDHLTLLNVYRQWRANGMRDAWCNAHFIQPKAMRRAHEVHDQLADILRQQKIEVMRLTVAVDREEAVRRCISAAHVSKAARMHGLGQYVNLRSGLPCSLHPTSAIFGLGYAPEYVVYHELLLTSKEYMQCVTAVDPAWLAEAGPAFYSLRITEAVPSRATVETRPLVKTPGQMFKVPERRVINFSSITTPLRPGVDYFPPKSPMETPTKADLGAGLPTLVSAIKKDGKDPDFVAPGKRLPGASSKRRINADM